MRLNFSTLFLCSILLVAVFASTECTSHKGWVKVKAFLKDFTSSDSTFTDGLNQMIAAFEGSTPTVATADSLGKCSDYAGQKSCCNAGIVKYLDSIVLQKVKPILTRTNMINKFVKFYFQLISLNDCAAKQGVTKPASVDDILANIDNFPDLKALINGAKPIKIAFAKSISAFTRGAVCLACSGTDSVSQYFNSDDKVILSQASVKAYTDAAYASMINFDNLFNGGDLQRAASGVLQYYLDAQSTCIASGNDQISQFSGKFDYKTKAGSVCTGLNLYVSDTACQNVMDGNSVIDNLVPVSSVPPVVERRFLPVTNYNDAVAAATSTGGVNTYIVSATDDKITDSGSMTVETTFTPSSSSSSSSSPNSEARLTFLQALILFSLNLLVF